MWVIVGAGLCLCTRVGSLCFTVFCIVYPSLAGPTMVLYMRYSIYTLLVQWRDAVWGVYTVDCFRHKLYLISVIF